MSKTIDYKNYSAYILTAEGKKDITIGLAQKPDSINSDYSNDFEKKLSIGGSVNSRTGDGKVKITLEYDVGSGVHDWLKSLYDFGTSEQRSFLYLKADRGYTVDAIRNVMLTTITKNASGTNTFTFEGEPSEETVVQKQKDILKGYI